MSEHSEDHIDQGEDLCDFLSDLPPTPEVQIYVKTLTGKTLTLTVCLDMNVMKLMKIIHEMEKVPIDQQRLIFNGHELPQSVTPLAYYIKPGATIDLVVVPKPDDKCWKEQDSQQDMDEVSESEII